MSQGFNGKFFSILQPQGVKTVIYRINKTAKEFQGQLPQYTVERLISSEEINANGIKKTFFVDYPEPTGEDLVILSFSQGKVAVNMGKLKNDKVKFAKTQIPVHFDTITTNQPLETKEFKYTVGLQRSFTIIDPETAEEVKPMVYLDPNTNEIKGTCKLKPNKPYFTFEIK